jgi:hypothetical protein
LISATKAPRLKDTQSNKNKCHKLCDSFVFLCLCG